MMPSPPPVPHAQLAQAWEAGERGQERAGGGRGILGEVLLRLGMGRGGTRKLKLVYTIPHVTSD